jgi:hypothetical protein
MIKKPKIVVPKLVDPKSKMAGCATVDFDEKRTDF